MDELEWLSDYVVGFMKSSTWVVPIAQFVDDSCDIFDDENEGSENKLEYTACHQQFAKLVGDLLAAHLLEVSVTPEMFDHFCHQGLSEKQELHRVLIEQLLAVDDFLTFKAMMAKHNAHLYKEVVTLDAEGCIDIEEPLSPTREVASQLVREALDTSEWHLYEDQLFNNTNSNSEEGIEALRRCEEAELQHAIALSLQLEEERLRHGDLGAPGPADSLARECQLSAPPSCYVPLSMQIREVESSPTPPPGAGFRSMPLMHNLPCVSDPSPAPCVEVFLAPIEQSEATFARAAPFPCGGFASAPLVPLLPHRSDAVHRLMRVEPLTVAPLRPLDAPIAVAGALRDRAERALAPLRTGPVSPTHAPADQLWAPLPPAPAPIPANVALAAAMASAGAGGGQTAEERRQRADHLRDQRDRLLQKRRQDRTQQLTQAMAVGSRTSHVAAAVDRALQSSGPAAAGRRIVAELSPQAINPEGHQPPDASAAAQQMRHALTVQLRQNLVRSGSQVGTEAALSNQLDRLERMQAGGC